MLHRTILAAAVFASVASAQLSVVLPAGTATVEGNSSNAFPWGRGGTGLYHQCVYDSSHFTSQGITYPIVITGLRWRPNTGVGLAATGYGQATVALSTCPLDQAAVSTTLASNQGADRAVVYSGAVNWAAQASQTGPTPFGIVVPLTSNFIYDPSLGDLNIEVDLPIQSPAPGSFQLDVQTTNALASRIFVSTGYPGTGTGTIGLNHAVVVQVDYQPANGLYSGFNADVTTGPSPLTVNFTDATFTSAPGGVLGWAWDFDGDSIIDSTLQNPSHTYTNCGSYSVSLTTVDGVNPPSTFTRTNYIVTDRTTANFTEQVIGPFTVLFTDTSIGGATSWAWDLDGDNVVDSTSQNAAWVYPNANPVNVTLTVSRLCGPTSTITKAIVPVQSISQNVLPNNGLSTGASVYFDLDVTNPAGISITSMDVAPSTANTAFTVEMFVKPGTYVGSTGTAADWVSAGIGSSAGGASTAAASANVAFPQALYLPPGQHGIKLWYIGVGPRYQTGSGITTVTNGDLSLTVGTSRGSSVTDPWAGTDITPRWWSGVLYYGTHNLGGLAGFGRTAPGCAGTLGVPHVSSNLPQLGTTMTVNVTNLAQSFGIMITGFAGTVTDLTAFGAPGCSVRTSVDATSLLLGAGNAASWNFNVPNNPAFSGLILFHQALSIDPAANSLGVVMSDAAASQIGS